ncbi:hypothetical protein AB0392_24725 [Nonomuraea angiospora]|uniref:hypothetical protein n=1 Tax=Nonomuraea angiospora TaxID=46172 RepID=UPI00344ECF96
MIGLVIACGVVAVGSISILLVLRSWGGVALEVDPDVIREIRGLGQVVGEVSTGFTESDSIVVTDYVFLNVGDSGGPGALNYVSDSLREKGWSVVARPGYATQWQTDRWADTLLTVELIDKGKDFLDLDVEKAARDAMAKAGNPDRILMAIVRRTDV